MDPSGLVLLSMSMEILTNGVSFSLVDGACCIINITNNIYKNRASTTITMNVNSTGAKNISGVFGLARDGNQGDGTAYSIGALTQTHFVPTTGLYFYISGNYIISGFLAEYAYYDVD